MPTALSSRGSLRFFAGLLLLLAGSLSARANGSGGEEPAAASLPTLLSPFETLVDTGPDGRVEVSYGAFERALFAAVHRRGEATLLSSFPLPGGRRVDLVLRPVALAVEGSARVVGSRGVEERLSPSVLAFAGSLPDRPGRAFLGLSRELFAGYVEVDGRRYVLSLARDRGVVTAPDGSLPSAWKKTGGSGALEEWCGTHSEALSPRRGEPGGAAHALETGHPGPSIRVADLFLECDDEYAKLFVSPQAALDYAALLVTAASEVYRRDLGLVLRVPAGYLRLWTSVPPWGPISGFGEIDDVRDWWSGPNNPLAGLPRAAVHVLTHPVFGGVSNGIGGACDAGSGYGISSVYGTLPYPVQHTSSANWDLFVLGHELGHAFGAAHASELGIECDDGSGPDKGTLMGYCQLAHGIAQVGMRFHAVTQDVIRKSLRGFPCLPVTPHAAGDYDLSGSLELADLAELDAYRVQGFVSRGAAETFDMNADGRVDARDRDVLVARIAGKPAASWTTRNGSGVNCDCLEPRTAPVLGTEWRLDVRYAGPPVLTAVTVRTQVSAPRTTTFGELLVGGRRLLSRSKLSNGTAAEHAIAIPYDPTLAGSAASVQAVRFLPTGPELTNAVDFVVSLY